jgi:hypothetical protein
MFEPRQEVFMRRLFSVLTLVLVVIVSAGAARAEVKSVRMHIAGYLCGN